MAQLVERAVAADPAPALGRGLTLLGALDREGACSLEQLARMHRWPKSSVARLLRSLELAGVVHRDPATMRYHATTRFVRLHGLTEDVRRCAQADMVSLASAVEHTVELHGFNDRDSDRPLVMIDRCEPEGVAVRVHARIGFARQLDEIDALTQVVLAFGGEGVRAAAHRPWVWRQGRRAWLTAPAVQRLAHKARLARAAMDEDVNSNGVFRYAAPILDGDQRLRAVIAIAQFVTPRRKPRQAAMRRCVAETAQRIGVMLSHHSPLHGDG
jgi:DNA-binding IclR family transcriptional regulator